MRERKITLNREIKMRTQCLRVLGAAVAVLAMASVAGAQTTDHLKCYKIKDVAQFKSATADLTPSQVQFVTENCSLKGKGAQLCVPADKSGVVIEGGTILNFPTDAANDAQLCYKIKCPNTATLSVQVSDQFGTRFIAKGKATKVCGPAFEQ